MTASIFKFDRWLAVSSLLCFGLPSSELSATSSGSGPTCSTLAQLMAGRPGIKSVKGAVIPSTASTIAFCRIEILYSRIANERINVVVALPLSASDRGSGRIRGAWNGRTQGLGGGGCTGNLLDASDSNVSAALSDGYVVSGNDLGHTGDDCEPGVNLDGTYNREFIDDFIRNGVKQQVLLSKAIAKAYYGISPSYNYWNGCSTGGRQGYLLAQELPDELDGIMANAPAIYWSRFQTAQMWGQIVMRELVGASISPPKLAQVQASAIAACDGKDGLVDGIIDDPRSCHFSAQSNVCGSPSAPSENCLTPTEAAAVDKIWDGPRNQQNNRIWFGLERGSDFGTLDGPFPFPYGVRQFHWDEHDRTYDWRRVSVKAYAAVAQDASRNIADMTQTAAPLDAFKAHGSKLLTFVGMNDQGIFPRGIIHYYRLMAVRYSKAGTPDYGELQGFYRLFLAPGVEHCGGGAGPAPVNPFNALVNWVENGEPPNALLASGGAAAPPSGRTRPLCPYPQKAIYNGSGSINEAQNFHCGGNLETRSVACNDVLVKYKHEKDGGLDFRGTGVSEGDCKGL